MMDTGGRIPPERAPAVKERLAEVRRGWRSEGKLALRPTAEAVRQAAEQLRVELTVDFNTVSRYEGGGDPARDTAPTTAYVRAFSRAFRDSHFARTKGLDEAGLLSYLMADNVVGVFRPELEDIRGEWNRRTARRIAQRRVSPQTLTDLHRDLLRERVALVLEFSSGIPRPQQGREEFPRDTLSWIHDDLQRLFWRAFFNRGLTEEELLRAAAGLGRLIPTPPRLPVSDREHTRGFRSYPEIDEDRLKRWWLHQSAALDLLVRDRSSEESVADAMNLGRFGEGGFPVSWHAWMEGQRSPATWDTDELVETALELTPEKAWSPTGRLDPETLAKLVIDRGRTDSTRAPGPRRTGPSGVQSPAAHGEAKARPKKSATTKKRGGKHP